MVDFYGKLVGKYTVRPMDPLGKVRVLKCWDPGSMASNQIRILSSVKAPPRKSLGDFKDVGVSKSNSTPKWMVYNEHLNNPIKMDDLGVPLFLETLMCVWHESMSSG